MESHGRVLMIACAFPPTGGSGVQRSAKFAKYLPQFGWLPTVWTIDGLEGMPRDETLLDDLPPGVIVHAVQWDQRLRRARNLARRIRRTNGITSAIGKALGWRLEARLASAERGLLPDQYASWAKAGVDPLCRMIARERIDAIYSTFSPASNHLLALKLKQKTKLPWVADFRDLWTDDYRYIEPSSDRRAAHRRLEQQVLETADVVVGVSERQTAILADHVGMRRHRFVTITNGFDPEDFARRKRGHDPPYGLDTVRERGPFVLAHVGRFDRWRTDEAWFAGLRRFIACLGSGRGRFQLRIVGHASRQTRARLHATGAMCTFPGYVSHAEAVREMCSADALLVNVQRGRNDESVIPAKLFEYLAAQRPVLAVGPSGGECERIVLSCRAGITAAYDQYAIAAALCELYDAWWSRRPMAGCRPDRLGAFSRVTLTNTLATILDGLVAHTQRGRLEQPYRSARTVEPVGA